MNIKCVWEHNGNDTLLYAENYVGAFARGGNKEIAMQKMKQEVITYLRWKNEMIFEMSEPEIVQEKESDLNICDADSDVIFDTEKNPLTWEEYVNLRDLALKSAKDFYSLYDSVPDKDKSCLPERKTFYGTIPRTAREMYEHTKNVNTYYFGEIGVEADNDGTIYECRKRGFELLEQQAGFLEKPAVQGSYDEWWSLRKVLRRFIWHDRIHAKAMYRMAVKTFGAGDVPDIFHFGDRVFEGIYEIVDKEEKSAIATEVLEDLPEWFGLPDSTREYIETSRNLPFWAYYTEGEAAGFIVMKETSRYTAEVYVMGVKKRFHRKKIGQKLMQQLMNRAYEDGYEFLQVKTVDEGHYEEYDRTRLFYEKMGFKKLECFPTLWDAWNPCLVMVCSLDKVQACLNEKSE